MKEKFQILIQWATKPNKLTRNIYLPVSRSCHYLSIFDDLKSTSRTKRGTRPLTRSAFERYLKTTLNCPAKEATDIWLAHPTLGLRCLNDVRSNVDLLTVKGVTTPFILDNPFLLSVKRVSLRSRMFILESMKPDKIEDFLPLAKVADAQLNKIKAIADVDAEIIPRRHRIYHFSELFDMPPDVISKYVSNEPFMLELPFADIDQRIKLMLTYKTPAQALSRLSSIKNSVEFHESLRQAKLKADLESNEKKLSIAENCANRLQCDIETVEIMLKANPRVARMDLETIDQKLDFMLDEVGVNVSHIICSPYLLVGNLQVMRKRFHELQSYGYAHQGPRHMLQKCALSENHYTEFLVKLKEQWEQQQQEQTPPPPPPPSSYFTNLRKLFPF